MSISYLKIALVLGLLVSPTAGLADWFYKKEDNAFDDAKSSHIALTANNFRYALVARCIDGELSLLFATPEKLDASDARALNLLSPKLLFRVDTNPISEVSIRIDLVDGNLVAISASDQSIQDQLNQLILAKNRISAAIKVSTETFHNQNFSARNSGRTVRNVMNGCKS